MSLRSGGVLFTSFLVVVISSLMNSLMGQVEWTSGDNNPVLEKDPGTWASASVAASSLMHREGEPYKLWYSGSAVSNLCSDLFWRYWQLGCATSDNLQGPWQKDLNNPCLSFDFNGPTWDVGNRGSSVLFD